MKCEITLKYCDCSICRMINDAHNRQMENIIRLNEFKIEEANQMKIDKSMEYIVKCLKEFLGKLNDDSIKEDVKLGLRVFLHHALETRSKKDVLELVTFLANMDRNSEFYEKFVVFSLDYARENDGLVKSEHIEFVRNKLNVDNLEIIKFNADNNSYTLQFYVDDRIIVINNRKMVFTDYTSKENIDYEIYWRDKENLEKGLENISKDIAIFRP